MAASPPTDLKDRPAWADAPWTLHVVVICLAIAAVIKTFVPSSNFFINFVVASVYGFSIRYGSKLLRHFFPSLSLWTCLAIATPVGIAIGASFDFFVIDTHSRLGIKSYDLPLWQYLLTSLIFSAAAMYFVTTRGHLLQAKAELQQQLIERTNQEKLLAESRLHALQAQIEPHFIFNTLANVQGLIETDPAAARRMLESFTRLLRLTLQRSRNGEATFGQEIEVIRAYLSIQQQRLGERLRFHIEAPSTLETLPFPPLLLQPLVENAVKHGIEPAIDGGEVTLTVAAEADKLVIRVRDTGRGFAETSEHGIGLANVRARLRSLYGDSATLTLTENSGLGVCATVEVPRAALD